MANTIASRQGIRLGIACALMTIAAAAPVFAGGGGEVMPANAYPKD